MFSIMIISPDCMELTDSKVEASFKSSINLIDTPTNSPNRLAIGLRDNSGFLSPLGLPR